MKVAVIASYAPSLLNFRGPLLAAMVQTGHEVLACAPGEDQAVSDALAHIGVSYQSIDLSRTGINPLRDVRTILNLYRVLRHFGPDMVLGYTVKPVVYGSLAARLAGVPRHYSIITGLGFSFVDSPHVEDQRKRRLLNKLIRWLYRLSLSSNAAVFFQNPDDRALFIRLKLIPEDRTVLVNGSGVDLDHFAESPVKARTQPTFLLIARLLKEKGIMEYVEAAAIIKKKNPKVTFQLLGPLDRNDSASITEAELAEWQHSVIDYLGVTNDVRPFIIDSDVYVLPSFYGEGTPRTILEAMAVGRPIITTDAPGCRETVIEGENGFLIPVRDVSALVAAMEKFIDHPELIQLMGKRSREIAEKKYDVHKVNAIIMESMKLSV